MITVSWLNALALFVCLVKVVEGNPALDTALAHLRHGRLLEARQAINRLPNSSRSTPPVRLLLATTAFEEQEAQKLLRGLIVDSSAGDSVRSMAYERLASLAMVKRNYTEAVRLWDSASILSSDPLPFRLRQFHAVLAAGQFSAAADVISKLEKSDSTAGLYCRGLLFQHQRRWAESHSAFTAALRRLSATSLLYYPTLAGCAISSERLGYLTQAAQYRTQLEQGVESSVEKSLFASGFASVPSSLPVSPPSRSNINEPSSSVVTRSKSEKYTVQVGSFATAANAERLAQRIEKELGNVRINEARIGDNTHYRVRVGTFDDRETAERFAREHVSPLGFSYKVVKE